MMFIVRGNAAPPETPGVQIKLSRQTPPYANESPGTTDFFCLGEATAMTALREAGCHLVELRDGYYEDGKDGGVAIWGQGKYWEIRDTPFTVKEAVGPTGEPGSADAAGEHVNVRRAIFGA